MEFLNELEKGIKEFLPREAMVEKLEYEGPEIAIYTKNIQFFLENPQYIKELASQFKKRFVLRTDPSLRKPPEEVKSFINKAFQDAGIKSIFFDPVFGEVIIVAEKLGIIIGKEGEGLKKIIKETGWIPKLKREPTTPSDFIKGVREFLIKSGEERVKNLKKIGKRIYRKKMKKTDWVRITALGGSREVGRSCFLLETPESKVLLDCGVNVASVENAFPLLSSLNFTLDELDAVIISHGHLDHCGFLPYLFNYGYKGPVYCTEATRDVMALLQLDYIDVLEKNAKNPPYTEKDVKKELKHCIARSYGEVTDIAPDIRITLHNAGHMLGSSLIHIHVGEGAHNILYTGDLKFGFTELLDPAETTFPRLETLIIESTYGSPQDIMPSRRESEERLIRIIKETLEKGGVAIIPSFAVGRAQEVMLIVEKYLKEDDVNVYLDGMTKDANAIHSIYPEYLKKTVRKRILRSDSPFDAPIFKTADPKKRKDIIEEGNAIIIAPSGMMVGGPVIEYFKYACEDEKNALIFVGYQAEGSLGRKIQRGVKEIALEDDGKLRAFDVKMRVESVEGLSGHADFNQLLGYVKRLQPRPRRIITVHGEEKKCVGMAKIYAQKFRVESIAPRNLDSVRVL